MKYIEGRTLEQLLAVVDGEEPARTSDNALHSAFGADVRPGSGALGCLRAEQSRFLVFHRGAVFLRAKDAAG
jgi:hypothetical protein